MKKKKSNDDKKQTLKTEDDTHRSHTIGVSKAWRNRIMRECRLHQRERWISRSLRGAPRNVETNRQYGSGQMPVGRIASWIFVVYAVCVTVATKTQGVEGFASRGTGLQAFRQVYLGDKISGRIEIALSMVDKGNKNDDSKSQQSFDDFGEEDVGSGGASMLEDLDWRVNKLRLEEANTRRFLKSGPRFLPYEECCKWVQAFGRWHSKEDWVDWISMGEKRNAYIPSRPDEYYGRLGQWISWEHFLGVSGEES